MAKEPANTSSGGIPDHIVNKVLNEAKEVLTLARGWKSVAENRGNRSDVAVARACEVGNLVGHLAHIGNRYHLDDDPDWSNPQSDWGDLKSKKPVLAALKDLHISARKAWDVIKLFDPGDWMWLDDLAQAVEGLREIVESRSSEGKAVPQVPILASKSELCRALHKDRTHRDYLEVLRQTGELILTEAANPHGWARYEAVFRDLALHEQVRARVETERAEKAESRWRDSR